MSNKKIRTRFAPSPTGYVHVGGLRTALYSYLFAKQNNGEYILRIEDTDQSREVAGASEKLIKALCDIGLVHDEGPYLDNDRIIEKGDCGPYFQSKRTALHQKHAKQLIDEGKAYYCFCTPERLDILRKDMQAQKLAPKYDRRCCEISEEEINKKIAEGEKHVVRFKIPDGDEVVCNDLVRGKVVFKIKGLDDFVILKSDGFPTYHLAHVVDDYMMKISHILRSEEWLPSLPKHLLMWQAFGWETPQYAHLPLLLNPDKSKLSKRQGDVAVEDYLDKGYLADALINYVALLGWNPGEGSEEEIFSISELIEKFDINKVNKSGAVFNVEKLDWMNGVYIRKMNIDKLVESCIPYINQWLVETPFMASNTEVSDEYIKKIVAVEQERLKRLSDITNNISFFFNDELNYDPNKLIWKKSDKEETKINLNLALELLNLIDENDFIIENLDSKFRELMQDKDIKAGNILWPVRFALTGEDRSPSPFEVAWVLGKSKSVQRIKDAVDRVWAL